MKNTFVICLTLITALSGYGQSSLYEFQESDLNDFENIYLELKEKPTGMAYSFYGSIKDCETDRNKNVLHPSGKYGIETDAEKLRNRVFRINEIVDKTGAEFSSTKYSKTNPIFVISDTASGEVIYYRYDKTSLNITKYDYFPFNIIKSALNEEKLCEAIERRVDDFTGEKTLSTPVITGFGVSPLIAFKTTKDGSTKYRLNISTIGRTATVDGKGVIILMEDGSKLEFPSEISVDVNDRGFKYSAFMQLNESDVKVLSSKKVSKFRLYIYDETLETEFADKFITYMNCLIKAD